MGDKLNLAELYPLIAEGIKNGGTYRFYPNGTSMLPLIKEGKDSVVLSAAKSLKKGDIVLYQRLNKMFVIHRIIKEESTFSMCGDNQFSVEKGIKPEQVLAKVTAIYKNEELITFDNKKYIRYVRLLPLRRLKLKTAHYIKAAFRKIFRSR